jgi:hypothetical protein
VPVSADRSSAADPTLLPRPSGIARRVLGAALFRQNDVVEDETCLLASPERESGIVGRAAIADGQHGCGAAHRVIPPFLQYRVEPDRSRT